MAKELHLVDPKMLERMISPPEPKQRVLNQLDREMQTILDRQDLPDREKVTLYNQVLQRYLNYKNAKTSPSLLPKQHASNVIESDILRSLPKIPHLRSKGINILDRIKQDPNMTWNERGEFVYQGDAIPRSNMIDLINAMIRPRKHIRAHGWHPFARALHDSNIPQEYITNPNVWNWMQREPASDDDDFGTADDMSADESPPPSPHYSSALRPRGRAPSRTPVNKPRVASSSPPSDKKLSLKDVKKSLKNEWKTNIF